MKKLILGLAFAMLGSSVVRAADSQDCMDRVDGKVCMGDLIMSEGTANADDVREGRTLLGDVSGNLEVVGKVVFLDSSTGETQIEIIQKSITGMDSEVADSLLEQIPSTMTVKKSQALIYSVNCIGEICKGTPVAIDSGGHGVVESMFTNGSVLVQESKMFKKDAGVGLYFSGQLTKR